MTQLSERQLRSRWQRFVGDPEVVLLDGFHCLKHAMRFDAEVLLAVAVDKPATLALASSLADDVVEPLRRSLVEVPRAFYRELVVPEHPTGVAALARKPSPEDGQEPRRSPVVVLDNPRSLGNIGAVVRLAAGLDASGVLTTGTADPWHPHAVRGSAGLHFAVPVHRVGDGIFYSASARRDDIFYPASARRGDIFHSASARRDADLPSGPLYALDPDGADIRSLDIPDDALLAFGSERHGISPDLKRRADALIAIPMRPRVSSYNLATSVAMALFHWSSRRDQDRGRPRG